MSGKIKVTLNKSTIGVLPVHKNCVRGLGLRKIRHSVILEDTRAIRGMIQKVIHMVSVEEIRS